MSRSKSRSNEGKCFLVGAGPGDLGLVTLRAKELLERADVIVYDALANPEMLGWARVDAEIIFAGKRAGEVFSSSTTVETPRRPSSMASVRPHGPPPTMTTAQSCFSLTELPGGMI